MAISPKVQAFVLATAQRIVRSMAAALLGYLAAAGVTTLSFDWPEGLSTAGFAGLVTLLLCLAGQATSGNGPAFGGVELTSPPAEEDAVDNPRALGNTREG